MTSPRFPLGAGAALLVLIAGCSSGPTPAPVKGVVIMEGGQPVVGATVTFLSEDNQRPAFGKTDSGGRFELTTFKEGDGAFPGKYKVVVNSPPILGQGVPMKGKEKDKSKPPGDFHANYSDVAKTPLRQVVPPPGEVRLELKKDGN